MNWMQAVMDAKKAGAVYPGDQQQKGTTMSGKYIDLAPQIASMHDQPLGTMRVVLGLLDEFASDHPDQVPGRTVTESEAKPLRGIMVRRDGHPALKIEDYLGLTIVPDPEPTNAEKLADALQAYAGIDLRTAKAVAEDLSREGWTKAPGGDDER